jgi:predicted DNA-binding transcriptional regulator YafY
MGTVSMTPDQRRQVPDLLAEDPTLSQREIAKSIGVSQKTVSRDIAEVRAARRAAYDSPSPVESQPFSPQISRGSALVARLRAEMAEQGLIPISTEEEQLALASEVADRISRLQRIIAADGERVKLADGRVVLHPAMAEVRQCEALLSRIVAHINTMAEPA